MDYRNKKIGKNKLPDSAEEINLIPILLAIYKKLWLIILVAVVFGGAFFTGTKFLIKPTYRATFTAYVNNKSQVNIPSDTLTSSDLNAAEKLVRAYSKTLRSRTVLLTAAQSINLDESYDSLKGKVTTAVENETGIITVYVVDKTPEAAYNLALALATSAPEQIAEIIEGSSMKVIDTPVMPKSIYKPNYIKNGFLGALLGALFTVVLVVIMFASDDKVKSEKDLEERFAIPIVGVLPDINLTSKDSDYYYDYSYTYKHHDHKKSGGNNGTK